MDYYLWGGAIAIALWLLRKLQIRLRLSRAKHPSLGGHARISRRLAKFIPFYEYSENEVFGIDGATPAIVATRKRAFENLASRLRSKCPETLRSNDDLQPYLSDMQFTNANRVPFQFRNLVQEQLPLGAMADASSGVRLRDLDGNWSYDVGGSYGVNLLGYDFYKGCMDRAADKVRMLGPVLGPYHPVMRDNLVMLKKISGLDEFSFHMSGTEAVMQAVRLARYHSGRSHLLMACGAYHGWWDGVQPGIGHRRSLDDIYMLRDQDEATLKVLRTRNDIACVLVNPLQALHPNKGASSDAMLIGGGRSAGFDKAAYTRWLQDLRDVCRERNIVLIFDEVFVGFRLGQGGAQTFFGVDADMVTYGKTIGGGLPVGVLAGKSELMRRYRKDNPADLCFARGTFNSHPYVMAAMHEFLTYAVSEEFKVSIDGAETLWNRRFADLNERLAAAKLPVRLHNLSSIALLEYNHAGRFNWLLQYYLRAEGLSLSWVGTGRFIFSHNYTDSDFKEVADRVVAAATKMQEAKWWSPATATTDAAIRKQVLWEMIRQRFGRRRAQRESSDQSVRPSTDTAVTSGRS